MIVAGGLLFQDLRFVEILPVVFVDKQTAAPFDGLGYRLNHFGRERRTAVTAPQSSVLLDKAFGGIIGPVDNNLALLCLVVDSLFNPFQDNRQPYFGPNGNVLCDIKPKAAHK